MPEYKGHCHCGQTEWTVEIPEEKHILCHCGACKLQSGGEFTLNQIVPKDGFKLTKGDLKVYTYKGDSGNNTDCFFCANCTCSPYHHQHVQGRFRHLSALMLPPLSNSIFDTQINTLHRRRQDRHPHRSARGLRQMGQARRRDLRQRPRLMAASDRRRQLRYSAWCLRPIIHKGLAREGGESELRRWERQRHFMSRAGMRDCSTN